MKRAWSLISAKPLLACLALCLVVKSLLVLSLADVFFYGEELEKGTAAKAMLDSLAVPHHQLAYHYYEGGGFVISHLKALAFLAVGQNLLAHKLVALAFMLAVLAAGWQFTRAAFGERAARWFGVLLVLAPASFQKLSLINLGIHFEACLFLFGVLGLGLRLARAESSPKREWFSLGLVTGFGLYFSYQVALAAGWVALVLAFTRRREVFGLGGVFGLLGTLVGALPLLVMYSLVGAELFNIHGDSITGAASGPSNLQLFGEFARSVFIEADFGARVTAYVWVFATLAATYVLHASCAATRRSCHFVLGYLGLFALVYATSGFLQGRVFHFFVLLRLAPVWVFATVLVAAALGSLQGSPRAGLRRVALVFGGLLLAVGLRASVEVMATGHPESLFSNLGVLRRSKGYSYDQYFAKVFWHFDGEVADKLELVEAFDEPARAWLRAEAVGNLMRDGSLAPGQSVPLALGVFGQLDPARLADYEFGLGPLVVIGSNWDAGRALALVDANPGELGALLIEAVGRFGAGGHPLRVNLDREVQRAAQCSRPELYWRGLGRWVYNRFRLSEARAAAFCGVYDERVTTALMEGYRAERAWREFER